MDAKMYRWRNRIRGFFVHTFLGLTAFTCLFPLFWMVRSSLMSNDTIFTDKSLIPSQLHFSNFAVAWTKGNFGVYLLNSILYTATVVFGIIVVASLAAYAFSRLRFPGKNFFFFIFLTAMMIPLPGSFVPLYVLMTKLGLINTRIGYILCMINVGLALSIFLLKTFFDKIPSELEDAARIDGCSKLGIWRHVALPLAKPALAVIVIFNSLNVWNEYILAFLLFNDKSKMPLQLGLWYFKGATSVEYGFLMAGLTITVAPILLFYLVMQKHIIKGISAGAIVR